MLPEIAKYIKYTPRVSAGGGRPEPSFGEVRVVCGTSPNYQGAVKKNFHK